MSLLKNYLSLHLKISLEYKSSFILTVISQSLALLVELFTVMTLFNKFKLLDVYNTYELLLGFSTLWLGYSLVEMFGRGFDHFSKIIINGNFDILLIRPRSIFIQVIGTEICYEKIGRVSLSLFMFIFSALKVIKDISILKILLLVLMLFGTILIVLSVIIIGASFCFVTIQGLEVINIITNGTRQVGQYPMGIYKKGVRLFFSIVIPIALVNYYPLNYLTGRSNNLIYLLLPLYSIVIFILSNIIFQLGTKKYTSSGS